MSDALRDALAAASTLPTSHSWSAICAALEGLEGDALDEAIALASPITSSWPDYICEAPDAWLTRCMEAGREPRLRLVSTLSTLSRRISFKAIERLLASPDLTSIRDLHLYRAPLSPHALDALCDNPALANLRDLRLDGCQLGPAGALRLAASSLPPLRELAIAEDPLGDEATRSLLASPLCAALTRLDLSALALTPGFVLDALARLGPLESLALAGCGLDDSHLPALASWPHLAALQGLNLGDNAITGDGFAALCAGGALDALDWLDLSGCPLGPLAIPPRLTRLSHLNLTNCQLGDAGAAAIAAAQADEPLMFLDLGDNQIGPAGALALARSPRLAGVEFFHIQRNPVGDDGLLALLTSPHIRQLNGVGAEYCEVSYGFATRLGEVLAAQPALRDLFLLHNHVTDAGALAIAATPAASRLRNLVLLHNPLTAQGWRALADSPHIDAAWRAVYQREASR